MACELPSLYVEVMESNGGDSHRILREIESLKAAKSDIDHRISVFEAQLCDIRIKDETNSTSSRSPLSNGDSGFGHGLSLDMIYTYSHHLLLPSFGVQGQSGLLKSSILVVGAGGLGSPVLLYHAACGVGKMSTLNNASYTATIEKEHNTTINNSDILILH